MLCMMHHLDFKLPRSRSDHYLAKKDQAQPKVAMMFLDIASKIRYFEAKLHIAVAVQIRTEFKLSYNECLSILPV